MLTDTQVAAYHADGYVLAKHLFDTEEISLLSRTAKEDNELDKRSFGRADGEGGVVRLSLWNHRAMASTACSPGAKEWYGVANNSSAARFTTTTRK